MRLASRPGALANRARGDGACSPTQRDRGGEAYEILSRTGSGGAAPPSLIAVTRRRREPAGSRSARPPIPPAKHFVDAISVDRMLVHERALQRVADENEAHARRLALAGLPGVARLRRRRRSSASGYNAEGRPCSTSRSGRRRSRRVLNQVSPTPKVVPCRAPRPTTTSRPPTSSRWPTRRRSTLDRRAGVPGRRHRRPARPAARRSGCADADYAGVAGKVALIAARHVPVRREVERAPGRGRDRRDHLQRGQHGRAPEPDLRRQPARPRRRRSRP